MAGYIGSKSSVTQVDGYSEAEADAEFVNDPNDVITVSGSNVGIGTSSPAEQLHIHGDASATRLRISGGGLNNTYGGFVEGEGVGGSGGRLRLGVVDNSTDRVGIEMSAQLSNIVFNTGSSEAEAMRIDSSGRVGIGTSSPSTYDSRSNNLVVGDSGDAGVTIFSGATSNARLQFAPSGATGLDNGLIDYDNNNDSMSFATGGSDAMRIDSSGKVIIGTEPDDTYSNGWSSTGGIQHSSRDSTAGRTHYTFRNPNGSVGSIQTNGSSTSYNTSSDYRLKENVVDLTGASARVNQLNPSRFNFIADGTDTAVDGFLAHEVATVVPEAITGTKDAMKDEEYEVTPATGDIYTPATDEVDEVIHSADAEQPETLEDGQQWRETTAAVMGTRSVPDYQGIDQSKLVPLLTAALQEALTEIASLKTRVEALEA